MKKILIFTLLLLIIFVLQAKGEEEIEKIIDEQYRTVDMNQIQRAADQTLDSEIQQVIPDFDIERLTKEITSGNLEWNLKDIILRFIKLLMKEVYVNIKIMLQIIVLSIVLGILTNLQSSFGKEGVNEVAFFACYIFLVGLFIKSFTYCINLGRNVIDNMVMFMQSMIPTLITLLISTGNITSASIFQPAVLFAVQMIGAVIKSFLIPFLFFNTALTMVNNVSDKFHVTQLVNVLNQLIKWTLGIMLTIFIGVITVQGLASSMIDGVGSKAVKFAVGNFIPIVGGILSDAVDTVIGCSLILKNAVGIVGLFLVILICITPLIKISSLIIIYRLAGAIIEPVSDKRVVNCISQLGNSLTYVFAMVLSVAIMFILSITIMIGAGNIAAMLR